MMLYILSRVYPDLFISHNNLLLAGKHYKHVEHRQKNNLPLLYPVYTLNTNTRPSYTGISHFINKTLHYTT